MAKEKIYIEGNINEQNLKMYQMYKGYIKLKGLSENTIEGYEYDLFQWFRFLNSYQMDKVYNEVQEEDIEEYLMYCKMHGNEASRLQRRAASISSFYIFLRRKKKVTVNPVEFIERPKKKLLELKKHYDKNNINLPYIFLSKYRGKYQHAANSSAANWVHRAGLLIGIPNLTPHSLRRTAATLMLHSGMELMDVSAILNHESMDTTKIYIQRDKKKLKYLKDKINI